MPLVGERVWWLLALVQIAILCESTVSWVFWLWKYIMCSIFFIYTAYYVVYVSLLLYSVRDREIFGDLDIILIQDVENRPYCWRVMCTHGAFSSMTLTTIRTLQLLVNCQLAAWKYRVPQTHSERLIICRKTSVEMYQNLNLCFLCFLLYFCCLNIWYKYIEIIW